MERLERRRPRTPPARPLVLIVDGHGDMGQLYRFGLEALGFETLTAVNGARAFQSAWEIHPDLIVAELALPGVWSLVRDLKHDARTREIPVVVLTGNDQSSERERADSEGCAVFLLKPCLPEDLATRLRAVLAGTPTRDGDPSTV